MRDGLRLMKKINPCAVRDRTLRVGTRIDAMELPGAQPRQPPYEWILAIDGGFVEEEERQTPRSFEILNGRLDGPKGEAGVVGVLFWGRSEVPGLHEGLDSLVQTQAGTSTTRLSVITDGANGIQSTIAGSVCATPILDWLPISMRVRYLEQIVRGLLPRSRPAVHAGKRCKTWRQQMAWDSGMRTLQKSAATNANRSRCSVRVL